MATLRRPLIISCAVHAAIAVLVGVVVARPSVVDEPAGARGEIALGAVPVPLPPSVVPVEMASAGGTASSSAAHVSPAVVPVPAPPARPAPTVRTASAAAVAPEVAEAIPRPAADPAEAATIEQTVEDTDKTQTAPATAATAGASEGDGGGDRAAPGANGNGEGSGEGWGGDRGEGYGRGRGGLGERADLHARILGDESVDVRPREGFPILTHAEATALRERDTFPRLPERLWTAGGPYIVAFEVCVAESGQVSEATLRSSASARLDPIALAAVKTWRYRPHLVAGRPTAFCHGVIIKYERW